MADLFTVVRDLSSIWSQFWEKMVLTSSPPMCQPAELQYVPSCTTVSQVETCREEGELTKVQSGH